MVVVVVVVSEEEEEEDNTWTNAQVFVVVHLSMQRQQLRRTFSLSMEVASHGETRLVGAVAVAVAVSS